MIYPYVVEGGFTVVSKSPDTGLYDAHFGMILTRTRRSATHGYERTDPGRRRTASNRPMNVNARCDEPATQSNARGAQNAPPAQRAPRRTGGSRSWRRTTRTTARGCPGATRAA